MDSYNPHTESTETSNLIKATLDRCVFDNQIDVGSDAILDPNRWTLELYEKVKTYYSSLYSESQALPLDPEIVGDDVTANLPLDPEYFLNGVIGYLLVHESPNTGLAEGMYPWIAVSREFSVAIGLEPKLEVLAREFAEKSIKDLGEANAARLPKKIDKKDNPVLIDQLTSFYTRGLRNATLKIIQLITNYEEEGPTMVFAHRYNAVRTDLENRIANYDLLVAYVKEKGEFPRDIKGIEAETYDLILPKGAFLPLVGILSHQSAEMTGEELL